MRPTKTFLTYTPPPPLLKKKFTERLCQNQKRPLPTKVYTQFKRRNTAKAFKGKRWELRSPLALVSKYQRLTAPRSIQLQTLCPYHCNYPGTKLVLNLYFVDEKQQKNWSKLFLLFLIILVTSKIS